MLTIYEKLEFESNFLRHSNPLFMHLKGQLHHRPVVPVVSATITLAWMVEINNISGRLEKSHLEGGEAEIWTCWQSSSPHLCESDLE